MKYHGGRRFGLPEERQSYIYWLCRNVERLPARQKKVILRTIEECSKGEKEALKEALCSGRTLYNVAMRHYVSEAALQRRCEEFYKKAAKLL